MAGSILETAIKNRQIGLELEYYEVSTSDKKGTARDGFTNLSPRNHSQAEFICLLSILLNQGGHAA
jgi:hypothetical protein